MNIDKKLQVDLILQSLSDSYGQFIMNYHMNKIDATLSELLNYHMNKLDASLSELLNMLVTAESTLKSSRDTVLAVEQTSFKRKSSFKKKKKSMKKQKNKVKSKKQVPKKGDDKRKYFHCNVEGHQRRNCPTYLATVKSRKNDGPSEGTSELLVIETNLMVSSSSSWVINFDSSAHLYTSMQGLEEVRGLKGRLDHSLGRQQSKGCCCGH